TVFAWNLTSGYLACWWPQSTPHASSSRPGSPDPDPGDGLCPPWAVHWYEWTARAGATIGTRGPTGNRPLRSPHGPSKRPSASRLTLHRTSCARSAAMTLFPIRSGKTHLSRTGRAARRARAVFLPQACELEGRTLLSTLTVVNDQGSGPGSLP